MTDEQIYMPVENDVEHVLAFPAYLIEDYLSAFKLTQGILTGETADEIFQSLLESGEFAYIPRDEAEEDPEWKQLIPYTVLRRGREVFRYQRTKKAGETRLHDKWSVGVGGHINPEDGLTDLVEGDTYENAVWRELQEEVGLEGRETAILNKLALLYDDSDEVGQVHFGVVHQLQVGFNTKLTFKDPSLQSGHWQHPAELRDVESFEKWSQLVISLL